MLLLSTRVTGQFFWLCERVSLVLQTHKKTCHQFSEITLLVAMGMLQGAPRLPTNEQFVTAGNLACCLGNQRLCRSSDEELFLPATYYKRKTALKTLCVLVVYGRNIILEYEILYSILSSRKNSH